MPTLVNLLAVGAAVIIAGFVTLFANDAPREARPLPEMPSLGVVPSDASFANLLTPLAASVSALATTASPAATSTLDLGQTVLIPKTIPPKTAPVATPPLNQAQTAPVPSAPPAAAAPAESADNLNKTVGLVRGALVNIICVPKSGPLHSASASGVVIDSRGVILTVAHMAQYFLLEDYPKPGSVTCVIRDGSPAATAYTASLAYISPDWVKDNLHVLDEAAPTGTGENDFALLAITGSATKAPLPDSFTAIPLSSETPAKGESVTVGSYGAEFLSSSQVKSELYPIVVFGMVGDRYTFSAKTVDLITVDNTAAAQEGSSGGAVVTAGNQLTGLITTSSSGSAIASRDLHAITPRHIRASFLNDTGKEFDAYIANSSPAEMAADFADEAHALGQKLGKAVE